MQTGTFAHSAPRGIAAPALPPRALLLAGRLAYILVLVLATLQSLEFDPDVVNAASRLDEAFNPLLSARDLVDAVRNVALFAGWGAVYVITGRPAERLLSTLLGAAVWGFTLSATIETLQLFSQVRTASLLDLVTNTGGAAGGAAFTASVIALAWGMRGWKSYVGLPGLVFAGSYALATFCEALIPLMRSVPLVGVYGGPLSRFGAALSEIRFGMSELAFTDVLLFFPLGVLSVAALVELKHSYGRAAARTVLFGLALSAVGEVARGALGLPIELGVIAVHAVAIALGAVAAAAGLAPFSRAFRGRRRAQAVALAYALVLMLWAWRPFLPEWNLEDILAQFSIERFIPLEAARWRMDLFSVSDIAGQFCRFLPVGALLAVWPVRRRGALSGFLPGLYLAGTLELAQAFVAGRYFDVGTDLAVQCAGVALGWLMMRHAGFGPHGDLVVGGRQVGRTVRR